MENGGKQPEEILLDLENAPVVVGPRPQDDAVQSSPPRLGQVFLMYDLIDEVQLQQALSESKRRGIRLGQTLVETEVLSQDQINWALAHHLQIPYLALNNDMITPALVRKLPETVLRHYQVVPLVDVEQELTVAMADPTNLEAIEAIENASGQHVKVSIASPEAIEAAIDAVFSEPRAASASDFFHTVTPLDVHLAQAVTSRVEEICFRPTKDVVCISFMRGSEVIEQVEPRANYEQISTRLRRIAGLPLDSKQFHRAVFDHKIGTTTHRIGCAIMPTVHGEAITLRLLRRNPAPRLVELEVQRPIVDRIKPLLSRGRGLALAIGPDSHHNAALLHAMLGVLPGPRSRIVTIERSSRFDCEGTLQISLDELGDDVSPATAVEHALAGRPTALLLDSMLALPKDSAAELLRAAMAETLVLSAIETVDPLQAVTLLRQLVHPALLASTLQFILICAPLRLLCRECSEKVGAADPVLELLPQPLSETAQPRRARGCGACHRGTVGMIPLHALVESDELLQRALIDEIPSNVLGELLHGSITAVQRRASELVSNGRVSPEEALARLCWPQQNGRTR